MSCLAAARVPQQRGHLLPQCSVCLWTQTPEQADLSDSFASWIADVAPASCRFVSTFALCPLRDHGSSGDTTQVRVGMQGHTDSGHAETTVLGEETTCCYSQLQSPVGRTEWGWSVVGAFEAMHGINIDALSGHRLIASETLKSRGSSAGQRSSRISDTVQTGPLRGQPGRENGEPQALRWAVKDVSPAVQSELRRVWTTLTLRTVFCLWLHHGHPERSPAGKGEGDPVCRAPPRTTHRGDTNTLFTGKIRWSLKGR